MRRIAAMAGLICSALGVVQVAPVTEARAQAALDARCAGAAETPGRDGIAVCTEAIESGAFAGKELAGLLVRRATAHGQAGDLDACLADLDAALALDPANVFALGARGDVYLVKKDYPRALAAYAAAGDRDPDNVAVLVGRGIVRIALGDLDAALADFEQAVRVQPGAAMGLYWRGYVRRLKGDPAGAADIVAAKRIDPQVDR